MLNVIGALYGLLLSLVWAFIAAYVAGTLVMLVVLTGGMTIECVGR